MERSSFEERWVETSAAAVVVVVLVTIGVATHVAAQTTESGTEPGTAPEGNHSSIADDVADQESLRERVAHLLSGYHFTPSRQQLDAVATPGKVAETLRSIASDTSVRPSLRGRAVDSLALYEDAETVAFLEQLLAPPDAELAEKRRRIAADLRHRAIFAYAENRSAEAAVERLAPLVDEQSRQIQLTVVAALGQHAGEVGKTRLASLAAEIEDDIVRDELAKYIDLDRIPNSED